MGDAPRNFETQTRLLGCTEQNWTKAVAGGTGITTLALQISKEPDLPRFKKALQKLQNDHPSLNSMLHKNPSTGSTSFIINPPIPHLRLNLINLSKTSELLRTLTSHGSNASLSPLHAILEHELNINEWSDVASRSSTCMGVGLHLWCASVYTLPDQKWLLVLRLHAAICDRTTAVMLLKELKEAIWEEGEGYKEKGNVGIEGLIPVGKAKKTIWAHGKDMVAYSVNSLMLTNLKFKDVKSPRRSEVVRLKMNKEDTQMLLAGCKLRGIKLCGALVAATLLAAYSSKRRSSNNHRKKYGVVFLNDCRQYLQPSLSVHEFGFYHSAISTSQEMKGEETLWDLATKIYTTFENSKKNNKHFSDMADLNFLMTKAIENPSLTPSSSMRTSLVSAFEDPIIETSSDIEREIGLDYIGGASAHGIGPSVGLFDTVRDGQLDCACVYPAPLHSREQMQELIEKMKNILIESLKVEGKVA
ncbi:hypothetical protein SSX86_028632 [Deinandra increscens subsp. villosa]|uniref:Condensation domain-containing protein n=1 Tax=Deinandra increscens subsp. villosa TaxID=3103831 RepID=A0AAP0GL09_9ASTR